MILNAKVKLVPSWMSICSGLPCALNTSIRGLLWSQRKVETIWPGSQDSPQTDRFILLHHALEGSSAPANIGYSHALSIGVLTCRSEIPHHQNFLSFFASPHDLLYLFTKITVLGLFVNFLSPHCKGQWPLRAETWFTHRQNLNA